MLKYHYMGHLHEDSSLVAVVGNFEMIVNNQRHFFEKLTEVAIYKIANYLSMIVLQREGLNANRAGSSKA